MMTIVLIIFLLFNLSVGLYYGRGVKNIREYALGKRNFSTALLVSTIVGTFIGGDYLFITTHEVYSTGLHYAIACCGMPLYLLIVSYFFVPRMGEFLGSLSVADAMGNMYGKKVRIISAISSSIGSIGYIAVQFKVLAAIFAYTLTISSVVATVLAASIVILYSAFGGMRAVIFTDLIQFFTFLVVIPLVAITVCGYYLNMDNIIKPTYEIFNIKNFIGFDNHKWWEMVFLFLLFAIPEFSPTLFQRISIGREVGQVQKAFNISALILLFLLITMSFIGFLIYSINPNLPVNTQEYAVIYYLIDNHLGLGVTIFLIIGIVAMSMSTADSKLNSTATILTHDLYRQLKNNITDKEELAVSKFFNILLGVGGIIVALYTQNMLSMIFMTQSFYMPIVCVPLMLSIFGFRSSSRAVMIGMATGVIVVILWQTKILFSSEIHSVIPGMIGSALGFIGAHYILGEKMDG